MIVSRLWTDPDGLRITKNAAKIIKAGEYATSTTYVEKLCSIIEKWNLTKYDKTESAAPAKKSVDTLAKEVIQSKRGSREKQKKRL